MNELDRIAQQKMTVKEVAEILGVTPEAIKKHVRNIFPHTITNGVAITLNELQITEIKRHMIPTTQVVAARTEVEMVEKTIEVFSWLKNKHEESQKKLEIANKQIETMKPKALTYDKFMNDSMLYEIGTVAKMIRGDVGRNKLKAWMRDNDIIMDNGDPYQNHKKHITVVPIEKNGRFYNTPHLTTSGVKYILDRYGL